MFQPHMLKHDELGVVEIDQHVEHHELGLDDIYQTF